MKMIVACGLLAATAIFFSCKKERSCEGCKENNKPPTAVAGPDQAITLPSDSILLDGSASNDPDGTISEWLWKKISGPASLNIVNATSAKAIVRNPDTGVYHFELIVTDNGNLSATDTVQIVVTDRGRPNRPPAANAGTDQTIILPTNTANLDGSASTDPDNNINSYAWTKISGPSSFTISNANAIQTQVINLVQGVYQFELKVTDAGGLFSKDTTQITVTNQSPPPATSCPPANRPLINAQLIPFGNLSIARAGVAAIAANNKLFFAGGYNAAGPSSRVDIYNLTTNTWSTGELSIARYDIVTAVSGDKVLFAGGYYSNGTSARVDIYNLTTQSWSVAELSEARFDMAVAVLGNKVFFGGGIFIGSNPNPLVPSSRVDIYDAVSNVWSTATLSEARGGIAAVATENKIYFAGGYVADNSGLPSNKIDIYDVTTGTWSTSALNIARAFFAGIYHNSKIYWAGGQVEDIYSGDWGGTCQVEVQNSNGQLVDSAYLNEDKSHIGAFKKGNKILYLWGVDPGLIHFDIHESSTNNWSIGLINQSGLTFTRTILASYDNIYFAGGGGGGIFTSQVWTLDF